MADGVRAAVLGASGYAGGELLRLLAGHPSIEITVVAGRDAAGSTVAGSHPHLSALPSSSLVIEAIDTDAIASRADLVFSALPNGVSSTVVPALLGAGATVIDLSGDFRLEAAAYPEWYGFDHPAPAWLDEAVYGLPELFAERIAGAKLVANPGCYPTPVVLGCAPLLASGLIDGPIRVDGKTGLSGAGRARTDATLFTATEESIRPYRIPGHQHTPEMERALTLASGRAAAVVFTPHLVPTVRGVVTTSYATLGRGATTDALTACLAAAYAGCAFIRTLPPGGMVDSKRTRGTNVVELQAVADPRTGTAIVIGALDNLIKGAAGQAIQNANLVHGWPETTALPTIAVYP